MDQNSIKTVGMCRIYFFISVRFLKNSDSVQNEFDSVQLKKTQFDSDIIVIKYSRNSGVPVVNLQHILQRQWMT